MLTARDPRGRHHWPIVLAASCARTGTGWLRPVRCRDSVWSSPPRGKSLLSSNKERYKVQRMPVSSGWGAASSCSCRNCEKEGNNLIFFNVLSVFWSHLRRVLWSIFTLLTWLRTLWLSCNCGKAFLSHNGKLLNTKSRTEHASKK